MESKYDVIIIGGGPAGLAAAVYACRAKLSTLIIEKVNFGGKIVLAKELANYPGGMLVESGQEFATRLIEQADSFGVKKIIADVTEVKLLDDTKKIMCGGVTYEANSVIIATGSASVKAVIKGEKEFTGLGVSYCATCDAPFFNGLDVYVVGNQDETIEEAIYLSKFARKVTIVCENNEFNVAIELLDQAKKIENISFLFNTRITELKGKDLLNSIIAENVVTKDIITIEASENESLGCFFAADKKPQNNIFEGIIEMDEGKIITDEKMCTNISCVFAAGDVRKKTLRQVVTATADGAIAAYEAGKSINIIEDRRK